MRMTTSRLEAFSDGVMAIAITLLVLDLVVPPRQAGGDQLTGELAREWPSYAAYVVSFLVVGIIWVNHHTLLSLAHSVDRSVLYANLALLLTVSTIPFPTRLLAEYLTAGGADAHVAAAVYSGTMFVMGGAFAVLFLAVTHDNRLLREPLTRSLRGRMFRRFGGGSICYLATIALAFISAPAVLAVHALLALYYALDPLGARSDRVPAAGDAAGETGLSGR